MEIPAKKLLRLLKPEEPAETRTAALLVIGELGLKDAELHGEILQRLTDPAAGVRMQAIRCVGQLKLDKALPVLLEKIPSGGAEASAAAETVAQLGAKGIKALQEQLHKVVPGVRRYIAAALTSSGSDAACMAVLLDKDPQVAASAASAILAQIPEMTPARKKELAAELIAIAKSKKPPMPVPAEPFVVRVLVGINEPSAADMMWDRVMPPHNHDVRSMALQAVGGWTTTPNKEQLSRLFHCAAESDFRIAAPAMAILNRVPVQEKALADWLALFEAPDTAARRLAIEKLGNRDDNKVAAGLIAQLTHTDRVLREAAQTQLQKTGAGRSALIEKLLNAKNPEEAWQLARIITVFKDQIDEETRESVAEKAFEHLENEDHRVEGMLFLLREIDHDWLQDRMVERAIGLRKKKKYDLAMMYLKTVARDPSIGFTVRFELATCGLKISRKEMSPLSRDEDPSLRNFDTLLGLDSDLLMKELQKAKFLDSEDLFYVGFHFAEQIGWSRQFGIDILKLVAQRDPKSDAGKAAKNKLKSVGA